MDLKMPTSEQQPPALDDDLARTVAFNLQKGGTAKTTTSALTAHALTRLGLRVLVIDGDHSNPALAGIMGLDMASGNFPTIVDAVTLPTARGQAYHAVVRAPDQWQPDPNVPWRAGGAYRPGGELWLIPGNNRLQRVVDGQWTEAGMATALRDALSGLAAQFDLVVIDTHPDKTPSTQMMLLASGAVVSPFIPEPIVVDQLIEQLHFLESFSGGWKHPLRFLGGICAKYQRAYKVAHGTTLDDAITRVEAHRPRMPVTEITTEQAPGGGEVRVGGVFPQVIPQLAELVRAQSALGPVTDPGLSALFTQIGLRIMQQIGSPRVAELAEMFTDDPLEGVWPLLDDTAPPQISWEKSTS